VTAEYDVGREIRLALMPFGCQRCLSLRRTG
jgi:hypothetical protein